MFLEFWKNGKSKNEIMVQKLNFGRKMKNGKCVFFQKKVRFDCEKPMFSPDFDEKVKMK